MPLLLRPWTLAHTDSSRTVPVRQSYGRAAELARKLDSYCECSPSWSSSRRQPGATRTRPLITAPTACMARASTYDTQPLGEVFGISEGSRQLWVYETSAAIHSSFDG